MKAVFISTNTSLRDKRVPRLNFPLGGPWGCGGGSEDTIATLTQQRTIGPNISPCLNNETLVDELNAAGLSWKYYTASLIGNGGYWNAFAAIRHIRYGSD